MDVIFNCPKCEQELAVNSSGAGSDINCPSCGESITHPRTRNGGPPARPGDPHQRPAHRAAHGQSHRLLGGGKGGDALARADPQDDREPDCQAAGPAGGRRQGHREKDATKTFRHNDCIEVGHDKFNEFVTTFLNKVGKANIISINTLTYTYLDIGTQKLLTDFGLLIVYRG